MIDLIETFKTNNLSPKIRNAIFEILKDNMDNYRIRYKDIFDYWFSEYYKPSSRLIKNNCVEYSFKYGTTMVYNPKRIRIKFSKSNFSRNLSGLIIKGHGYYDKEISSGTTFRHYLNQKFYDKFLWFKVLPKFIVFEQRNGYGSIIVLRYRNGSIAEYYKNMEGPQIRLLKKWNSNVSYDAQQWTEFRNLRSVPTDTILEWFDYGNN